MKNITILTTALVFILTTASFASQYYAAPTGTSSGDGSITKPWDLQTALSQPAAVKPGDTIWLRGGTYTGKFVSRLSGTTQNPIKVMAYSNEWPVLDGNFNSTLLSNMPAATIGGITTITVPSTLGISLVNELMIDQEQVQISKIINATSLSVVRGYQGSCNNAPCPAHAQGINIFLWGVTLEIYGQYTWFQGFEVMDSSTKRISQYPGSNSEFDISSTTGVEVEGAGTKTINLVIHDTGQGLATWSNAPDSEDYGDIIYNNGWIASDRWHGPGMYVQNKTGNKMFDSMIVLHNFYKDLQMYGSGNAFLNNMTWQNNIWMNGEILFGGIGPINNLVLNNNYTYNYPPRLGYSDPDNTGIQITNNYFPDGIDLQLSKNVSVVGNTFWGAGADISLTLNGTNNQLSDYSFSKNIYYQPDNSSPYWQFAISPNTGCEYWFNSSSKGYGWGTCKSNSWQQDLGFDTDGTFIPIAPNTLKVVVLPNKYDANRANIAIYNWGQAGTVDLGPYVSQILSKGDNYELHSVLDYFNDVATGQFDGSSLNVPMAASGHTVALPIGYATALGPNTFPAFGVFVLIKKNANQTPNSLGVSTAGTGFGMVYGTVSSNNIINCGVNPGASTCSANVNAGTSVTLTATAANGSSFSGWTITSSPAGTCTGTTSPCMVTVNTNTSVTANFTQQTFTLTVGAGTGGMISPSGNVTINYGASQTFTVTPNVGYTASLTVDGQAVSLTNNTYTLNDVTAAHAVEASFTLQTETITASAGAGGTISPSGTITVNYGASQLFTLTPNTGYTAIVTVDGKEVTLTNNTYTLSNITTNHGISVVFSNYALSSGPYSIIDLGIPLQTNTQEHQVMYTTNDSHRHLQLYYDTFGQRPMNVVDIDVENGKLLSGVFQNNMGRPGPQCHVFYPANDKFYMASSDPGSMSEFDPATGASRYVHSLHYKGAQYCEEGDDGWIYIGEITSAQSKGAGVERYDPRTDTWQDLGIIDPAFNGSEQYAYTLGADARYLYVGLGELPWYLAVYDTQATSNPITLYWADQGDSGGTVSRGSDGEWYYTRNSATQSWKTKTYKLTNGVPVEVSQPPAQAAWYAHGNTIDDQSAFSSIFHTQINLDNAEPNSSNNDTAIISLQTDSNPWQSVSVTGLSLAPSTIKRLYAWPGNSGKLLGWASDYGLVFSYDTQSNTIQGLGYPTRSLYDATFDGNTIYFSGYPSSTLRYGTTKAWTLSGSTPDVSLNSVNPYLLTLSGGDSAGAWAGKYNYYSSIGMDGFIYIGVHHERDSNGGGLGWYDPVSGTSNGLRAPFLNDDVRDVLAVNGGTKIVYSSSDLNKVAGRLFVLDVATKQIERTFNPVPNNISLDKIVEVEPGMVIGLTDSQQYFKANILTGETLWVKGLGATAFSGVSSYDRRLVKGPDGYVWLFIGTSLCRINPKDGSIETIMQNLPVSNIMFSGGDLYFYGTTGLKVIKGLFTAAHNSSVSVTASAGTGGTISPSGTVTVDYGANQTFTVTPNAGYTSALMLDGQPVTLTNNAYILSNVTRAHIVAANFTSQTETIMSPVRFLPSRRMRDVPTG